MSRYPVRNILLSLSACYALDLRALSLMRIGTALAVLTDLMIRLPDLEAHYSDRGVWPSALVKTFGWSPGNWSFHLLNGDKNFQLILFILHLIAAACLLGGFKTRVFSVVVWLFTISLHNRNLYILQGGDDLLRMLLFWGIFLPWGARYSLDARMRQRAAVNFAVPQLGYLLLIVSVYFFSVLLKRSPEWTSEGTAVYYALSLDQLRMPVTGDFIYRFPGLMKALTWLVLIIEILIPFLILWPSRRGINRWYAFCLIVLLHAGIGLSLYVGLFYLISMVAALGLLPARVMDQLEKKFRVEQKTNPQYLPEPAGLCGWFVNSVSAILIIFSLFLNLSTLPAFPYQVRAPLRFTAQALCLRQNWGMFSPGVMKQDGWYILEGLDSRGNEWDLRHNTSPVRYGKPQHIVRLYKSDRWRKLAENMQRDNYTFLRPPYCRYVLESWNRTHPEKQMQTLNFYFMEKENLPGYGATEIKKTLYCVTQ